jgi:hypothetical protein
MILEPVESIRIGIGLRKLEQSIGRSPEKQQGRNQGQRKDKPAA